MPDEPDYEECCTAGNPNFKPERIPLAWDLAKEELGDKSLYILRLIGIHLPRFTDVQKNRIIRVLMSILEIEPKIGKFRFGHGAYDFLDKVKQMDEQEKEDALVVLSEELQDLLDRYLEAGLDRDAVENLVENFIVNWGKQ